MADSHLRKAEKANKRKLNKKKKKISDDTNNISEPAIDDLIKSLKRQQSLNSQKSTVKSGDKNNDTVSRTNKTDNNVAKKRSSGLQETETKKKKQRIEATSVVNNKKVREDEDSQSFIENIDHLVNSHKQKKENHKDVKKSKGLTEERGGFMILGKVSETEKPKVERKLPHWIRTPHIVSPDLQLGHQPLSTIPNLSHHVINCLKSHGIHSFFPVQLQVIPAILNDSLHGLYTGRGGTYPGDICCSAPTGSGKTLSFVIPMVEILQSRVVPRIRCIVLLPVIELAQQVYQVFKLYTKSTIIKVALTCGQKSMAAEQAEMLRKTESGYKCLVDILVTTPGRLVDHINQTTGLDFTHLRYLIIDEADRMMTELKQDWLTRLNEAVYMTNPMQGSSDKFNQSVSQLSSKLTPRLPSKLNRSPPFPMTAANNAKMKVPLQKLVFSATLSVNPEVLQQLDLFQPTLFTSIKQNHTSTSSKDSLADKEELIGTFVKPPGLKELYCVVTSENKPLAISHLILNLNYSNVLCFTASRQSTNRLCLVLKKLGGINAKSVSSAQSAEARARSIAKFAKGQVQILVCTDALTRGIDIPSVDYVMSYDVPHHLLTYLHRIGRTARAGKAGTALTFVEPKEVKHYKSMLSQTGDTPVRYNLDLQQMLTLTPRVEEALEKAAKLFEHKSRHSVSKPPRKLKLGKHTVHKSDKIQKKDKLVTKSGHMKKLVNLKIKKPRERQSKSKKVEKTRK